MTSYFCPMCEIFVESRDWHYSLDKGYTHAACGTVLQSRARDAQAPEPPTSGKYLRTAMEIGALVEEKNKAYGSSFEKCGDFLRLLYPEGLRPEQYQDALALVRIFDKQMRIATAKDALGENPYRDIAGYGILMSAGDGK